MTELPPRNSDTVAENATSTTAASDPAEHDVIRSLFRPNVRLDRVEDLDESMLIEAFLSGRRHIRQASGHTDVCQPHLLLPPGAEIRMTLRTPRRNVVVAELSTEALVRVSIQSGHTDVFAVGQEIASVDAAVDQICDSLARDVQSDADVLRLVFWSGKGPSSRRISAPTWKEVAGNYAARTVGAIGDLMTATGVQSRAGRLVLWHGAPGTGKTTAVRALARGWAEWCTAHYVMDPERLFADPAYLMNVASTDTRSPDKRSWQLVIAEDCDEYLHADAKSRAGASLGRLLNLSDGILGHGLQVIVLLTTNEPIDRLHPAITRPGRCLNQAEFLPLSPLEAGVWLGNDKAHRPERPTTMAELFAIREKRATLTPALKQSSGGYL